MKHIQAIIFDLDGVLCFTDQYHFLAWKAIAIQEGIEFNQEINNRLRGVSRMDSLNIILEKAKHNYSLSEKEKLCEEKNNIYRSYLLKMKADDVSEEVKDTLDYLVRNSIPLAIGSSSKNTMTILGQLGISRYFNIIVDGNMISHSKPDPEVFLKASRLLGIPPKNCLVIEDAKVGIRAAKEGGFISAGLSDAKNSPFVTYKLNKITDIIEILKEAN